MAVCYVIVNPDQSQNLREDGIQGVGMNYSQALRCAGVRHQRNLRDGNLILPAVILPLYPAEHVFDTMEHIIDNSTSERLRRGFDRHRSLGHMVYEEFVRRNGHWQGASD